MARVLSNANFIAALSDGIALLTNRRGYSSAAAAAAAAAMGRGSRVRAVEEKMVKGKKEDTASSSSWVPDPVTGYYRPANRVGETDPAELRQILLSRKS